MFLNDPIGKAIHSYVLNGDTSPIQVESDLMEKDIIPIEYLFRTFEIMPPIEQEALNKCKGKILDVGACAGPHTTWLREKGFDVTAIDTSKGSIEYLNKKYSNYKNLNISVQELSDQQEKYDTILLLMNGIGIAGDLNSLPDFLEQLKKLLAKNGKILCDSTDVQYFYEEDDGGMWVDLNTEYYGNFKFNMHYDKVSSDWFKWLYIDPKTFEKAAEETGLSLKILQTEEHSYLAELTLMK